MDENKSEFLKECIADAIIDLMHKKPLAKITVNEIVNHAGVGRATYFRHFSSKEEAIIFKRRLLWRRYCDDLGITVRDRFFVSNAPAFFRFIYENRELSLLIYSTGNKAMLYNTYKGIAEDAPLGSDERFREKFLLYGLMGLLDEWHLSNFKDSPEQMTKQFEAIIASINSTEI